MVEYCGISREDQEGSRTSRHVFCVPHGGRISLQGKGSTQEKTHGEPVSDALVSFLFERSPRTKVSGAGDREPIPVKFSCLK